MSAEIEATPDTGGRASPDEGGINQAEPAIEDDAAAHRAESAWRTAAAVWQRVDRIVGWARLVQLLAIVPIAGMTLLVVQGTKLQWFDYWSIFPDIVNPDGSLAEFPTVVGSHNVGHINGHY